MSVVPRDDGLLGADPVAWRVIGHSGALVGGLRALIVQSLHPLAIAGVAEHSDYLRRPLERLHRTTYYVAATTFGDTATARRAVARVRRRHALVRGTDPVTGQRYSAEDPETQVWVHCTEWHSFLAAYRVFGGDLSAEEEDRYIAEGAVVGSLLGTPRERVPATVEHTRLYFASVRSRLCVSDAARAAIDFVVSPPLTRELMPYQAPLRVLAGAALALVPRDLRRLAGIDRPRALDAAAITAARPLVTAGGLPLLRELTALVVGRETHALIESRRPPARGDEVRHAA